MVDAAGMRHFEQMCPAATFALEAYSHSSGLWVWIFSAIILSFSQDTDALKQKEVTLSKSHMVKIVSY